LGAGRHGGHEPRRRRQGRGGRRQAPGRLVRADRQGRSNHQCQTGEDGEGWHVTMGPAAVLYREADKASGSYHVSASFTQSKADYPEGYGLVIGGSNLGAASQKYTYFLVREDGKFIIKRRNGPDE